MGFENVLPGVHRLHMVPVSYLIPYDPLEDKMRDGNSMYLMEREEMEATVRK